MTNMAGAMIPHSMLYAMIHSQPEVMAAALDNVEAPAGRAAEILAAASRVFLAGTGTNSHSAVVGEHLLRAAGVDAYATTNFDFATYPRPLRSGDAVIVLSHTGTTRYGAEAVGRARAAGVPVIGITGLGAPMPDVDVRIEVAPKELSDTYTQSYTAALAVLASIAVQTGDMPGRDMSILRAALRALPGNVKALLDRQQTLWPEAVSLSQRRRIILAGAGPNAVTAREGALKIKESSYLTAEGFELETMLHGGLQAVEAGDLAIVIAADGPALDRTLDAVRALNIIGASVLVLADERVIDRLPPSGRVRVFSFPPVPEQLSPLLATVPLQLLAAFTAFLLGTNPDNFRFDEPQYREAIESLVL
jgi:glucosamine--fructose-6-phosphate aminotransferase (isomerizing)